MNSKCDTSLTAETMKNEDGAFKIIIQQIEGGTIFLRNSDVGDFMMVADFGDRLIMMASFFIIMVIFLMHKIGHQHPKVVTNTFGLQNPLPTLM